MSSSSVRAFGPLRRGSCRGCRGRAARRALARPRRTRRSRPPAASPSRRSRSATSVTCTKASACRDPRGEGARRRAVARRRRRRARWRRDRRGRDRPRSSQSPSRARGRDAGAVAAGRGAEDPGQRPRRGGARRRARSSRRPRREPATARAAWSSSAIWSGKVSRKAPEMRTVTSMRGRSRSGCGTISKPVTRVEAWSQVGRTPIRARAWAMSSPPERRVGEAQRSMTIRRGQSPSSWRWRRTTSAAARAPSVGGGAGRDGARIEGREVAAGRQHVRRPAATASRRAPARRSGRRGRASRPARSPAARRPRSPRRRLAEDVQPVADRRPRRGRRDARRGAVSASSIGVAASTPQACARPRRRGPLAGCRAATRSARRGSSTLRPRSIPPRARAGRAASPVRPAVGHRRASGGRW